MGNEFNADFSSVAFDTPLRKPPVTLFISALVAEVIGTSVGLFGFYGVESANLGSTNSQYLFGVIGYLLSAVIPILLFQVFVTQHADRAKSSKSEPYDNYAGIRLQNIFKKLLAFGLVSAGFSVWVFLQPIAERFV